MEEFEAAFDKLQFTCDSVTSHRSLAKWAYIYGLKKAADIAHFDRVNWRPIGPYDKGYGEALRIMEKAIDTELKRVGGK